ncbi:hypothetical protein LTR50_000029 [Elasticomyces elasticus]|nr:hypothetical protein LTR50_000029 [Elasticomyces elasticus]
MDGATKKQYLADDPPTIVQLKIKDHFDALDEKEQQYAHYISKACFAGVRAQLRQVSPESELIYDFIVALHHQSDGDWTKFRQDAGLSDEDMKHFLDYAAMFLGNGGNYKSFGDAQFIPRIGLQQLAALAKTTPRTTKMFDDFKSAIYEKSPAKLMHLGYPSDGHLSTYYPDSANITKDEITEISDFLKEGKHLLPENTRLRKLDSGDYEVLIASAESKPSAPDRDTEDTEWTLPSSVGSKKISLVYGDYSQNMKAAADSLEQAVKYAANENQAAMHAAYAKSFRTGSMEQHKESQRHWIRDLQPTVECNIGFIESYRDPAGIRAEWEGFVAMVNKERTKQFGALVTSAPEQIPKLPWGKEFEKDKFLSPDFTSLEVLTFAGSGIPAGINIPNYDDIRQTEGFKNVSLGNVLSAKAPTEPFPFIKKTDQEVYRKCMDQAFEVQVGLHELLGHGCGKLLQETEPGVFNFDKENPPISPVTNKPVSTWYKPGQTWSSVFGSIAASYEECRAEAVAMALSCDFGILKIFGLGNGKPDMDNEAGDTLYSAYLSMARAGVTALQYWDPASKKWGQAHMQARHAILKTFLSAGPEFCSLDYADADTLSDLTIKIDRNKIVSHGRPAVESFLQKLHVFKATADMDAGKKMYEDITSVDEWWGTKVRAEVLRRAVPRKVYVQANTFIEGDKVVLKEYPATAEGMIQSYAERTYI